MAKDTCVIHVSVQFVPVGNKEEAYEKIDRAIAVFEKSGLLQYLSPLESILEGTYHEIMMAIGEAKDACLVNEQDELVINLRMHMAKDRHVSWQEKVKNR